MWESRKYKIMCVACPEALLKFKVEYQPHLRIICPIRVVFLCFSGQGDVCCIHKIHVKGKIKLTLCTLISSAGKTCTLSKQRSNMSLS